MAKLSERVKEQQMARRTRRPLPPSHPRRVPADAVLDQPAMAADQAIDEVDVTDDVDLTEPAEIVGLTASEVTDTQPSTSTLASVPEPVVIADPEPAVPAAPLALAVQPVAAAKVSANGGAAVPRKRTGPRSTEQEPVVAVPLEPRQVWLDQLNDLWLSECEYANVRRGGRKVISRSAVVRLALDQLRERMTSEEITDLLADREPTQSGRGRPRR